MKRIAWNFAAELARWGPRAAAVSAASDAPAPSLSAARAYCRSVAQSHYENFTVASWLLPRHLRPHFHAVYAYCRWADDLADEVPADDDSADGDSSGVAARNATPHRAVRLHSTAPTVTAAPVVEFTAVKRLELLDWWEAQLLDCYRGVPARHPVMVALGETIREFEIPAEPFCDLLVAFRQDQRVDHYETFDELLGYCRNSANPVGRLVLYLGRSHSPVNVELSDSICTGLQLANFWQDVAVDWRRGRCYLPLESLRVCGIGQRELEIGRATPALRQVLAAEVERAEVWLRAGLPLVGRVPGWLQIDLELFIRGGLAILNAIRRAEFDVWAARPTVSRGTQLRLLAGALTRRMLGRLPAGEARR
ncbi:MAG: squalene synthase HpnC [Pirellulales bacterium]|nr:squalene synthase HpnC [Pirellulales bacterium]